jgi:cell division protein FtsW
MINRSDRSGFAAWWFTIDRVTLVIVLSLIAIGLMLAFAASPASTGGPLTSGDFRYAARQLAFTLLAVGIMGATSILSLRQVKILAAVTFAVALVGTFLVLFIGADVLGARRELDFGPLHLQPSEFLKPSFAILAAAVLSDREKLPLPRPAITFLMLAPALLILLRQPDVGQTGLLLCLWGGMLFFWGMSFLWVGVGLGATGVLGFIAYEVFPHVHRRVDQFLSGEDGIGYQTGLALKAFAHGGLTGVGPGAGTVKYRIPDVHSDFIFAVAGEEFGLLLCGAIAILFCVLTVRLLLRAANAPQPFCQLAGAGLALVTAVQAFINMGVAVSLLPAKGMTLPFISYGGSSLFAMALTMGLALAVTRQRPKLAIRADGVIQWARA